jgi:hypothetical protein
MTTRIIILSQSRFATYGVLILYPSGREHTLVLGHLYPTITVPGTLGHAYFMYWNDILL